MMDLYRKVSKPYLGCEACQQHGCPYCFEYVKAEPCEHGHYSRHLLAVLENFERVWCDGTAKETNDA